jgi:hypothetical protein
VSQGVSRKDRGRCVVQIEQPQRRRSTSTGGIRSDRDGTCNVILIAEICGIFEIKKINEYPSRNKRLHVHSDVVNVEYRLTIDLDGGAKVAAEQMGLVANWLHPTRRRRHSIIAQPQRQRAAQSPTEVLGPALSLIWPSSGTFGRFHIRFRASRRSFGGFLIPC